MFNCLKEKKNESKFEIVVGLKFLVERSYLDPKKYGYLSSTVICVDHPKFIVLEINQKYTETVLKQDFHSKLKNQILKL
ncbi:hypothetical protein [Neobacillus niacini]|uniref:hypothetical protein n=1 Tax=Neobacillus niacini TaxID=86668 RepID=UPI0021CB8309|nr:hypothetical protein [Neobacillus niacini]MCM3763828.1 hypothetical protein [Neobacillus niacini]